MGTLRLGFAGTPDFAAKILLGLLQNNRRPEVVYTQPDRPVGRGRKLRPSPVKQLAAAQDIELLQPDTLRDPAAAPTLARLRLDVLVVAAYGLLLPEAILNTPAQGCINVHASLLPRWRGAAPIERAIMAGDTRTGVSIMRMDRGLDTGPVYLTRDCPIDDLTTGPGLEAALAEIGKQALLDCLDRLPYIKPVAQAAEGASYARKLQAADARIEWSRSAAEIDRQVRALCGRMPAFTFAGSTRVQVLEATAPPAPTSDKLPGAIVSASSRGGISVACGSGTLLITRLQLNRGKGLPLSTAQALNGFPELFGDGCVFHADPS